MKNLFLLLKILNLFSFGKDSFYFYYNNFYKKKNYFFINFNTYYNNFFFLNFKIFIYNIKKYSLNEKILRKIKISLIKKKKYFIIITNHHYLDNLEYTILNFLKKKYNLKFINIWYFNFYYFIKVYNFFFIKKYFYKILDYSNKNIKISRNFIRCLISKFIN